MQAMLSISQTYENTADYKIQTRSERSLAEGALTTIDAQPNSLGRGPFNPNLLYTGMHTLSLNRRDTAQPCNRVAAQRDTISHHFCINPTAEGPVMPATRL